MSVEAENTYRCEHCSYDVTQTLSDDIDTCPECGEAISIELCTPPIVDNAKLGIMERRYGLLVLALWFAESFVNAPAPTAGLLGLSSLLAAFFEGCTAHGRAGC